MRIIAGVCGLVIFSAAAFAQTGGRNCSIDGSVVNSVSGDPIVRAHVSVAIIGGDAFPAESDASGKWSVGHIACGSAVVSVSRTGFISAPRNRTQLLTPESQVYAVKLELVPQAVIEGRVLDDEGDPMPGVQVNLMSSKIVNGVRGMQAGVSAITNDLGEYRFAGLLSGRYLLCANAGGGVISASASRAYSEQCYPGPVDARPVVALSVPAGDDEKVDFTLSALATVSVSGVISGQPEGAAAVVSLMPAGQIARMSVDFSARSQPDGTFIIRNVPPGAYVASGSSADMTARAPIQVSTDDVTGVQLHLSPTVTLAGTVRIISASGRKPDKPQHLAFLTNVDPGGAGAMQGAIRDESKTSFTAPNLRPGNYRLELSPPEPFYVKSATMGGRDILNSEFAVAPGVSNIEIVISDDGGAVEGDVSADGGAAAAWVLLETGGTASRNVRTGAGGHFKIENVEPGDYKIYAWDDNSNVEYGNPEWMKQNAKGVAVTVEPKSTSQVKVVRQTAPPE